jgi:hypothetical protein
VEEAACSVGASPVDLDRTVAGLRAHPQAGHYFSGCEFLEVSHDANRKLCRPRIAAELIGGHWVGLDIDRWLTSLVSQLAGWHRISTADRVGAHAR